MSGLYRVDSKDDDVSWSSSDIRLELNRGVYKSLSVDPHTLLEALLHQADLWSFLLQKINVPLPPTTTLGDAMKQEWIKQRLTPQKTKHGFLSSSSLRPGDLLRGSANREWLLSTNPEFYQCLFLVLQNDNDFVVGVLLNHPMIHKDDDDDDDMVVRYGGNYNQLDIDEDMPPFALHKLGLIVEGSEPVGDTSVWKSSLECAMPHKDRVLLVKGLSIWDKQQDDHLEEWYRMGWLERVPSERVDGVWETLSAQSQPTSRVQMEANLHLSERAWEAAGGKTSSNDHLGRQVLQVWTETHIIENNENDLPSQLRP